MRGHFHVEFENGVKVDCLDLGIEEQLETLPIENAVKVLLQGLGENINREGLRKTPLRVAKALLYATKGYKENAKEIIHSALFPEAGLDNAVGHAGGLGGLVIIRDLDLFSYCESCLLPIQVKCHVGYVPTGQRVVGLSKLSRVADVYAKQAL
ncbi:GTP cyclohydrolase 1-like [Euphorbia lathyris]|uniref:GTP cyclohydrolase 1-like n=1 Tax=Euphorbia lathyris TaxID=212925 RepID=UPI003313FB54